MKPSLYHRAVRLKSLRLSGWRSFSPAMPLDLAPLGQVNIIIGANNTGKSNIGRFLEWLASTYKDTLRGPGQPPSLEHLMANHGPTNAYGRYLAVAPRDSWMQKQEPIEATLVLDADSTFRHGILDAVIDEGREVTIDFKWRLEKGPEDPHSYFVPRSRTGEPYFKGSYDSPEIWSFTGKYDRLGGGRSSPEAMVPLLLCQIIADGFARIPGVRHQSAQADAIGAYVIQTLASMSAQSGGSKDFGILRARLERWMRRLLGKPALRLDIVNLPNKSAQDAKVRFQLGNADSEPLIVDLDALGDGVAQMFYVLAYLALQPERSKVIALDEPELSLHPAAVVELIQIIRENFPLVQLIITTHSTTVLDAIEPGWKLFRMEQDEEERSRVASLDTRSERLSLLERMGIRPSQLFLANSVIWVEGPSDVVYLKALLRHRRVAPELIAGRDYTFIMYGGASGAALSFEEEPEDQDFSIKPLEIATNNIIIHDSDSARGDKDLHERVRRLLEELTRSGVKQPVLQTPGREIENLVKPAVLMTVVREQAPKHLKVGRRQIPLDYVDPVLCSGTAFDNAFSEAARASDGTEIGSDLRRKIRRTLSGRKSAIARSVVTHEEPFTEEAIEFGKQLAAGLR